MTRGLFKTGVLAATLVAGLAAAQAQGLPDPGDLDPAPQRLVQAGQVAPGDIEGAPDKADPIDAVFLRKPGPGAEYPLAPHVELVTGDGPRGAVGAPDLEPGLGEFAVGIKLDF